MRDFGASVYHNSNFAAYCNTRTKMMIEEELQEPSTCVGLKRDDFVDQEKKTYTATSLFF